MSNHSMQKNNQSGFTLVEIIVSTAIFTVVVAALLTLFNSTLSINRRVQAQRQVSQGTRNFTEMIAREIRNGRIDYASENSNCDRNNYKNEDNQSIALINKEGERLCFYLDASERALYVSNDSNESYAPEKINPPYFFINPSTFRFIVRPTVDPDQGPGNSNPGIQPFVTILAEFTFQQSHGQSLVVIPYQTSISTDVYDIPPATPDAIPED